MKISLCKIRSILLRMSLVNVRKSVFSCGFFTFTKEILNGKLHFLCSACSIYDQEVFRKLRKLALDLKCNLKTSSFLSTILQIFKYNKGKLQLPLTTASSSLSSVMFLSICLNTNYRIYSKEGLCSKEHLPRINPSPFYVKYLMSASLEWVPLFSLKRGAHLRDSI